MRSTARSVAQDIDDAPRRRDPFEALADPTRRAILGLLRDDGETTAGALAAAFPRISRPAVSRHLKILRQSKLVIARRAGREWYYTLDARGLGTVYRGWFEQFAPLWEQALQNLKQQVESAPAATSRPQRSRTR